MGVSGGGKNKTIVFSFRFSVLGKAKNLMKTENRKPKTENRKPKTENRKPKTENRKPKTIFIPIQLPFTRKHVCFLHGQQKTDL
jgi:hypothetical protein